MNKALNPILKSPVLYLLLAICFLGFSEAHATHLMGGDISYRYLDNNGNSGTPHRYEITVSIYSNCNSSSNFQGAPPNSVNIRIYNASDGSAYQTLTINRTNYSNITPTLPPGCNVGGLNDFCVFFATYTQTIELPTSFTGYHILYGLCCRNGDIRSLTNPGTTGQTMYTTIPETFTFDNNSPVFSDTLLPYLCQGDTTSFVDNAYDPDGDRLIYSFTNLYTANQGNPIPNTFTPPPDTVNYANGYSVAKPFGPNGYAIINSATGLTTYMAPDTGSYVVSVEIQEWREINGIDSLINTTRREIQIVVGSCPPNEIPQFDSSSIDTSTFTIQVGGNICFTVGATDANGDTIDISASSNLLNGSGGYNGPLATFTDTSGIGSVSSEFCWQLDCNYNYSNLYSVTVNLEDRGCPPKKNSFVYIIKVEPFSGPDSILGNDTLCQGDTAVVYEANGEPSSIYTWTITNGIQTSGDSSKTITVDWDANATTGKIKVVEKSAFGCDADSIEMDIVLVVPLKPDAGPDLYSCSSVSVPPSPVAMAGFSFNWSPGIYTNDSTILIPLITPPNNNFPACDTIEMVLTATNDTSGCSRTDTIIVINCPSPEADAGVDQYICDLTTFDLNGADTSGILTSTAVWDNGASLADSTLFITSGTFTPGSLPDSILYTLQVDHEHCSDQDSMWIITSPRPLVNSNYNPDTICVGDTVTLNSSGGVGLWWAINSAPNDTIDTLATIKHAPDTPTVFLAYAYDSVGCSSVADTLAVMVHQLPIVTAAASSDTICFSDPVTLLGSGANTYAWSLLTNPNDTISTLQNHLLTPAKTQDYLLKGEDTNSCRNLDTVQVWVNPLPNVVASTAIDSLCRGFNVQITATGADTYWWGAVKKPNDTISQNASFVITPDSTTDFVVTGTDTNGCVWMDTVRVVVHQLPIFTTSIIPDTICQQDTAVLEVNGNDAYWWAITSAPNDTISVADSFGVSPDTSTIYIMSAYDTFGCVLTDTLTLRVNPKPDTGNIIGVNYACPGVVDVLYWVDDSLPTTYTWFSTNGTLDTSLQGNDSMLIDWKILGQGDVRVVEINSFGCVSDTMSKMVNVDPNLTPIITIGPDSLCEDDLLNHDYGTIKQNGSTYTWTLIGGDLNSGQGSSLVNLNWDTLGVNSGRIYFIENNTTSDTVCVGTSDTLDVSIFPLPVLTSITGDLQRCNADTAQYIVSGDQAIYTWYSNAGTIVGGQGNDTVYIVWDSSGTFTLSVYGTGVGNCVGDTISETITIYELPQTSAIVGDSLLCYPNFLSSEYHVTGFASSYYDWSVNGGTITSGAGTDSVIIDWDDKTDTAFLSVTEITADSCSSVTQYLTIVRDGPLLNFEVVSDDYDQPVDVDLIWNANRLKHVKGEYLIFQKLWYSSDSWMFIDSTDQNEYTHQSQLTDTTAYQYTVGVVDLCKDTVTALPHNTVFLEGAGDEFADTISLKWNEYNNWTSGVQTYEVWRKLDAESDYTFYSDNSQDTVVKYTRTTTEGFEHCFRIKAVENGGSNESWSNERCLTFQHLIQVPDAFSPNQDGKNERWRIRNLWLYPNATVAIYNRWGNIVLPPFQNYTNNWDGKRNGRALPDGTYYYIIDLGTGNKEDQLTGSVTIIR